MKMYYGGDHRSHLRRLHKVSQGEMPLNKNRLHYFKKRCWVFSFQSELQCFVQPKKLTTMLRK